MGVDKAAEAAKLAKVAEAAEDAKVAAAAATSKAKPGPYLLSRVSTHVDRAREPMGAQGGHATVMASLR